MAEDGRQLFRQYPKCNEDYFIKYCKGLIKKFGKLILFIDRAPWHKTSKKVQQYILSQKKCLKVYWFPSGWPELNPTEECWRQGKNGDDLGRTFQPTFLGFKKAITKYYRTKRFNLNLERYLCQ